MTQDNLGLALRDLGGAVGGSGGSRRLNEAVAAHRQALTSAPATTCPRPGRGPRTTSATRSGIWASGRGSQGLRRLNEAVAAYRQALTSHPRGPAPGLGGDQNNLGIALGDLGRAVGEPEGLRRLNEAVGPTARPSPSSPATTGPSSGRRPRTTWATRLRAWASVRGVQRVCGG